jgi:hypothetical protein
MTWDRVIYLPRAFGGSTGSAKEFSAMSDFTNHRKWRAADLLQAKWQQLELHDTMRAKLTAITHLDGQELLSQN